MASTSVAPVKRQQPQQQTQTFAQTGSSDTFAATMQMQSTQQQQQQRQRQQSPVSSSLSFSSTLPRVSTLGAVPSAESVALASEWLRPAFQIGSTHGRVSFQADERVFHRTDVPPAARAAHDQITALLRTNLLASQASGGRPWDASTQSGVAIRGSKHCSWESSAQRFDDRFYHAMESEARVEAARARIEDIRAGRDPDPQPQNIQTQRWNVSTFIEEKNIKPLSATKEAAASQQQQQQKRPISHLPADYESLLSQQRHFSLQQRALKTSQDASDAAAADLQASWDAWARSSHVNGPAPGSSLHPHRAAQGEAQDRDALKAQVERTYPPEALATFLWQQENPAAAAAAGLEPLPDLYAHAGQAEHKTNHAHQPQSHSASRRLDQQQQQQYSSGGGGEAASLPYQSQVPPAWYRAEARTKQVATSKQRAPYAKFAHPGSFDWVEGGSARGGGGAGGRDDSHTQQQQQQWGAVGDEVRASGGHYRWSCCLHPLRDARGCQVVSVDPAKVRVVVARSDDPSTSAAWGLGSSKPSGVLAVAAVAARSAAAAASLDASHVRARSVQATAALSLSQHATPVLGGTAAAALASRGASGMGLSGPGVALVRRYEHSGRFELHQPSGDSLWSCCGAANKNELGCVAKNVTKEHRWQLESA